MLKAFVRRVKRHIDHSHREVLSLNGVHGDVLRVPIADHFAAARPEALRRSACRAPLNRRKCSPASRSPHCRNASSTADIYSLWPSVVSCTRCARRLATVSFWRRYVAHEVVRGASIAPTKAERQNQLGLGTNGRPSPAVAHPSAFLSSLAFFCFGPTNDQIHRTEHGARTLRIVWS